ncbi:MAG: DNA polymerase/3'-5' exonuclease PolX [Phycisphaerae bacterium]|nr:DNA polymerase/3'-5' exonuclease PolX [Phycisphaerae bacterium]MDD5380188.1 DNA polymerase/3'-5' exonuclease PolX [Phycisphaerae bacterium]
MKNAAISELFGQMADIMEILGDDRFRINSCRRVSRIIADMTTDIETLLASGDLAKTPGIGKSSLARIEEFVKTGKITAHKQLLKKIPPTLLDLLTVPGVGPKSVKAVYEKLNIKTIAGLKKAISSGSLAKLPGFGDKKAAAIAKGIGFLEKSTGRIRLDQALVAADIVTGFLKKLPSIGKIQTAGSLRRRAETIGDVDVLVASKNGKKIIDAFTKAAFVQQVLAAGPTKGSAIIRTETTPVHVDVRVVPKESFGAALQYFTGSKQHNVRLREIAVKAKLKLNEYGLFKANKRIAGAAEEEIYKKLGMDFIDPLLREDRGEIEAAKSHALPELIDFKDIKGDLHVHTNASDGHAGISEMVLAAKDFGYKYICITDHSKSAAIANGLSGKQLAAQIKQIRKLNEKIKGITILAGTEVEILADGSLDFDNKLLADLDFVIASIHSGMTGPREKVTARTLKAMDNPYVNCIAHPTGRLLGERGPMDIDMAAVIKHAVQTRTALEVNANPYRLDLKDVHCKMAIKAKAVLVIGTDSHRTTGFGAIGLGVATAARGWVTKSDVLNTLSAAKIKSWVKAKRP